MIGHRSAHVGVAAQTLGGLVGCTSGHATNHVHVTATPARALYDTPITVRVTGLHDGDKATISATSIASDNATWTDSAQFVADHAGTVTTDQAPVSGS